MARAPCSASFGPPDEQAAWVVREGGTPPEAVPREPADDLGTDRAEVIG